MSNLSHEEILAKGSFEVQEGVKVVKLKGEPYEIGFQHGYFLADKIELMVTQTLPAAASVVAKTLQSSFDVALEKMERGAKIAAKNIPEFLEIEMQGICDGMNYAGVSITLDEVKLWNTMYDQWCIYAHPHFWNIDNPDEKGQYPDGKPGTRVLTGSGCSSFCAWDDSVGKENRGGELIFCKNEDNLDLPYQLENRYLFIVDPTHHNGHMYMCFPGMVGMDGGFNEKGVSMMTQYDASIHETMDGCGIGTFTRLLLTYSDNLEEAIQTFYEHPRCTGIAYHCACAYSKTAAVVETSSKMVTVRYPMENFTRLWQANDSICYPGYQGYYGYNMVYDQQLVYELKDVSSIEKYLESQKDPYNFVVPAPCRFERYDFLLNEHYGNISVQTAKEIMCDRYDPYTKMTRPKISTSYTNNILATISAYYPKDVFENEINGEFRAGVGNLWSLLCYPKSGDFWLAIEDFPANQGEYKKFNLFELLNR